MKYSNSNNSPDPLKSFKAVLESSSEAILGIDKDGKCAFVNKAGLSLFGYTKKEIVGKNVHYITHYKTPEGKKISANECATHQSIIKGQRLRLAEQVLWTKKGKPIPVLISSAPIKEKGEVSGAVVTLIDVSEYNRFQEELKTYKDRLEYALGAGEIGVFEWNLKNNNHWWSKQEMALLNMTKKEVQGKVGMASKFYPDDIKQVSKLMNESFDKKQDYQAEFRIIGKDGMRWLAGRGKPYYDAKGKPEKLIGVNFDITERKNTEESLRFLIESGNILASSLDYQTTLNSLAELAVSKYADWCGIDMLGEDGKLNTVAIAHKDPEKIRLAQKLRAKFPVDLTVDSGVGKVLKTGEAEHYPFISPEMVVSTAKSPSHLKLLKRLGLTSVVIAPIKAKGQVVGVISLVSAESKRRFSELDFKMIKRLASSASLAIENAILFNDAKKERERLNELVSNVPGAVWELWGKPNDKNQKINFISRGVEKMLGYSVSEWINTPNFWLKCVHPDDQERAEKELVEIFEKGVGGISRFRWISKDGRIFWVEAQSTVMKDSKGKAVGMRGLMMDIAERMEFEKRKEDFISIASHELKTPIATIKGFTQIMQQMFEDDIDAKKYLDKMAGQVDRLTVLVSDLLDVSRIQSGKLQLQREHFHIDDLITDIVEDLQHTSSHNISFKGQGGNVYVDRYRISQVLNNLISNAIKFSPKAKEVIVSSYIKGDFQVIKVQDFGIGISRKNLNKIFDRFYQADSSIRQSFAGLGLGLNISKEIIERHGGKMLVDSVKGKGSSFEFMIPLVKTKEVKRELMRGKGGTNHFEKSIGL